MPENQKIIDSYEAFSELLTENDIDNIINNCVIKLNYEAFITELLNKPKLFFFNCTIDIKEDNFNQYEILKCDLSFKACVFKNRFKLKFLELQTNIEFYDCTFEYFILSNLIAKKDNVNINITSSHAKTLFVIGIDNINIKIHGYYEKLYNHFISSPLAIYNKKDETEQYLNYTYKSLVFNQYNSNIIYFSNCNFQSNFKIHSYDTKKLKAINFNSCKFDKIADFTNETFDLISISDSIFNDKLLIVDSKITSLELINCSFENTVKIVNLKELISSINIERSTIKGMFLLNAFGEGKRINLNDSTSNVSFKHLFVEPTGYLIIRQITNGKFNYDYANILGQIVMQELDIDSLQMHNASIIGSLIMQDIKLKELDLMNTSLIGKLVFNPSDTLNIFDSNIIQNRETAYLLKKGKQEEGDSISASHFKRKELRLYLNECLSEFYLWKKEKIDELKNLYNKWLKIPSKVLMCILFPFIPFIYILAILSMCIITPIILILNWLKVKRILDKECIVLFFNKISNDFGQSWVRGIIFTMSFAYIFYLLINFYGLEKPIFRFAWSLEGFGTAWKEYLKILNVLNFNDKLDNFKFTPLGETLFFVSKIFVSYGIYQTVSAFRKFGK